MQKIDRLIQIGRSLRAKESLAAQAGDYSLACLYNRAGFRAVALAIKLQTQDGSHHRTAFLINTYYVERMPWRPGDGQTALSTIVMEEEA